VAKVGFVAGTIQQDKINSFERLLFRATRGNMYLRTVTVGTIRDPSTGEEVEKSVFVVFFAGDRARAKVNKVSTDVLHPR
jgi:V-type H+-transporting ATPase subunit a